MATQNSINKKSQDLTIDPGASGDSYVQFDINTTGEFRIGVDDDASDAFKISQGSALGVNDTFIMTAAGERTMPLQPCFRVEIDSNITNVTGDGTAYTVIWDNEVFDIGSNMTTTTFTAPVDGKYFFASEVMIGDITAAFTVGVICFIESSGEYWNRLEKPGNLFTGDQYQINNTAIIDMDASDTVYVNLIYAGSTKTLDIDGNTGVGSVVNKFVGYLMH